MKLGEKILELRKKNGLSQEQLGEKINVTRQTISNWELGETSPNPEQLKLLSKTLKISIDELLDNDISNTLPKKEDNLKKQPTQLFKVLKYLGIIFIVILFIDILSLILFSFNGSLTKNQESSKVQILCTKESNSYIISIDTEENYTCQNCPKDIKTDIEELINYSNLDTTIISIEDYFKNIDGTCE